MQNISYITFLIIIVKQNKIVVYTLFLDIHLLPPDIGSYYSIINRKHCCQLL